MQGSEVTADRLLFYDPCTAACIEIPSIQSRFVQFALVSRPIGLPASDICI
jgi:hypothetical protein